jgi:hypothetical protein
MIKHILKLALIMMALWITATPTLAAEPAAKPFEVKLRLNEQDQPTLRWNEVPGATKYCIFYKVPYAEQCVDKADIDFPLYTKFGKDIDPKATFTVTAKDKDGKDIPGATATSSVGLNGVVTAQTEFGNFTGLGDYATKIMQYALPVGITLAIIMTIYAGIQYMLSQGSPDKIKDAQEILQGAVLGLIVLIMARFLVNFLIVPTSDLAISQGLPPAGVEEPK